MWEHDIEPNPTQVLVDGTVVIVAGVHDCDGNGRLVAVDASTGSERWSKPFEGGFSESAVTDGLVITAAEGSVVARESADGTQRWTADRFGDAQLQVAAAADTVIVGVNDPGSEPRDAPRVVALDSTTGQTRWVISLDGLGQILDVAVASDLAVVRASGTSTDDVGATVILGVSLSNGHIWWRHELGISEVSKPLLVAGDTVVVDLLISAWSAQTDAGTIEALGPSASVVVLDVDTGELRWRIDREFDLDDSDDQNLVESFSLSEDEVVGRIGSELVVWNARTGDQVWTSRAHGGGGGPGGGAWIAEEQVVAATPEQVGAGSSRIDASALSSGEEQWSRHLAADVAFAAATDAASFVTTWGKGNSCD
jgi:outer membrane protein assembly factor BamB